MTGASPASVFFCPQFQTFPSLPIIHPAENFRQRDIPYLHSRSDAQHEAPMHRAKEKEMKTVSAKEVVTAKERAASELSQIQQEEINEGIEQLDRGERVSFETVLKKIS